MRLKKSPGIPRKGAGLLTRTVTERRPRRAASQTRRGLGSATAAAGSPRIQLPPGLTPRHSQPRDPPRSLPKPWAPSPQATAHPPWVDSYRGHTCVCARVLCASTRPHPHTCCGRRWGLLSHSVRGWGLGRPPARTRLRLSGSRKCQGLLNPATFLGAKSVSIRVMAPAARPAASLQSLFLMHSLSGSH